MALPSSLNITISESLLEHIVKDSDSLIKGLRVERLKKEKGQTAMIRIFYPISDSEAPIEVGVVRKHFLPQHFTLCLNGDIGYKIYNKLVRSY